MLIEVAMKELWEMDNVLVADVMYSISQMEKAPMDECPRRNAIRSIFAYIEAQIYTLKQAMAVMAQIEGFVLSDEDKEAINELSLKTGPKKKKISFKDNLVYALKLLKRVARSDYEIDFTSPDYGLLMAGIPIRNRLMHPKSLQSLRVTKEDVLICMKGGRWLHDQMIGIVNSRGKA